MIELKNVSKTYGKGVKAVDDPLIESMMWLCLSEPSLTIALPFFTNVDEVPEFIRSGSTGDGMAGSSDIVRRNVYNYGNGRYGDRYADTFKLLEIQQHTFKIQKRMFDSYESHVIDWRNQTPKDAATNMTNWTFDQHALAKASYDSIHTILSVFDKEIPGIETFKLLQNYPNPFNSTTIIPFYSSTISDISLKIYNLQGEKVWQWQNKKLPPNFYQIYFNSANLPSGVYYYHLSIDDQNSMKKMIIVK